METPSQLKAINSQFPAILVVAGAGSGKTRVMVQRIARLIREGTPASSILVLTFTRKAAKELKERLSKLISETETRQIWVGTFHAVSYRMLAKWGEKIGYKTTGGQSITVITPEESEILLDQVATEYGWKGTKKEIQEWKQEVAHKGEADLPPDMKRILQEYWAVLRQCNALDFDQILLETHRLFRECPEALNYFRSKFTHVMVDEYQDTDTIQYRLHEILEPPNLFCVGDPRQAIYGWRGADVSIIQGFERDHPGAEVIDLLECFRCGRQIVESANRLIAHNPEGEKGLIPVIPEGTVEVRRGDADQIASFLSEDLAGVPPEKVAVLARTHGKLNEILTIGTVCHGLDLHKVGATTNAIRDSLDWKTFQAVVRMVMNQRDNIAWLSYGAGWQGLSGADQRIVKDHALSAGCSLLESCIDLGIGRIDDLTYLSGFVHGPIIEFYSVWNALDDSKWMNPGKLFDCEHEGVDQGAMSPADWLAWVNTADMHTELEEGQKQTVLLTAHAAKGLEWDVVVLAGFDRNCFPSSRATKEGHLDEERRLAYVAFTRAKKRLVIFTEKPSEFIREAGL